MLVLKANFVVTKQFLLNLKNKIKKKSFHTNWIISDIKHGRHTDGTYR